MSDDQSRKTLERQVKVAKRKLSTLDEVDGSKKNMTMKKPPTAAQRKLKRLREKAQVDEPNNRYILSRHHEEPLIRKINCACR